MINLCNFTKKIKKNLQGFRGFYRLGILLFLSFSSIKTYATHNRGGEITYRFISGNTYRIIVTTYTDISNPNNADRRTLPVKYSDNTIDTLPRVNASTLSVGVQQNIYEGIKTFPGPGNYIISVEDPNRNGGVINIPNSIFQVFYIETTISINPFLGPNNSVSLLNPPIDQACLGKKFIHNPSAFDIDGDSLSFDLVDCRGENGLVIPNYTLPQTSGLLSIDSQTGDFIWDSPIRNGPYNIAIRIREWRAGVLIGSVVRDMQITVIPCNNLPPVIRQVNDTCIRVGQSLNILITADEPDNQRVTLTATGGPLLFTNNPAQFTQPVSGIGTVSSVFTWTPGCNSVRKQPYQVVFRAVDNDLIQLVDLKSWQIKVIAPPPENLQAVSAGGKITLNWLPSVCENAIGYNIYRRIRPSNWNPDSCEIGVPSYTGFELIDTVMGHLSTIFIDDNSGSGLSSGVEYCYRVTALFSNFPDLETTFAESLASNETCEIVLRDLPVLTLADVTETNTTQGSINLRWSKPNQLDTSQFPGPYKYELKRYNGLGATGASTIIATFTAPSFYLLNDSTFTDNPLNTESNGSFYKIDFFFNTDELVGNSPGSSSLFLNTLSEAGAIRLNWDFNTTWTNDSFIVYRLNRNTLLFDSIAQVETPTYLDEGLINGVEYCYYVQSIGSFDDLSLPNPIINNSQIVCNIPKDTVPPCAPNLTINNNCDEFKNELAWQIDLSCSEDVRFYKVYFKPTILVEYTILDTFLRDIRTFDHLRTTTTAGCYYITAVDSSLNESAPSNEICIDNCAIYELPNVFTPNGDGINDILVPIQNRFIKTVDFKLFNRWGQLIFETNEPGINWDGTHPKSGNKVSSGPYFFICTYQNETLNGIEEIGLKGPIYIIIN